MLMGGEGVTELFSREGWSRKSWVESANEPECGFPLQSLPYCIFSGEDGTGRVGVGIGEQVLDLSACSRAGVMEGLPAAVCAALEGRTLNPLLECGTAAHQALRSRLMDLLDARAGGAVLEAVRAALLSMKEALWLKPIEPKNYTDFYASIHHATNVGRIFRPEQPLVPNYKFVPIGYHGRASSLVVSGTGVRRPAGQTRPMDAGGRPGFGPTKFMDYEVEVGMYIGAGNALGEPIPIENAAEHIFGLTLVNDWSARDVQSWEYQPLGPFLGKSFTTSVSPWVVPMAALAPFRVPALSRPAGDPAPMPYLWSDDDQRVGGIDLTVEVFLLTGAMRSEGKVAHQLSRANMRDLYWTPAQMIAHHTSNGCNLMPGDLLATGTISGAEENASGCLLEITHGGERPFRLPNGESREALEDGDEVILRGFCERAGLPRVSLGECRGVVLPAV
jgi:fumarylacetoacetase